jgi:hypothetical protein
MSDDLRDRFIQRAGLGAQPSLWEYVEAVREIPFGRTSERSADAVVAEWKGTCTTKHVLLSDLLEGRPEFDLQLVHRVYRLDRKTAAELFSDEVAALVPEKGLVDVHTYATASVAGERLRLDVTFPGNLWDGRSDMPLACADGDDYPVPEGTDPFALKEELVAKFCDPLVREPFIAALAA